MQEHVVIIGNGISGTTAARWIRKLSDHKITMISSESKFFFSRTALMYIYMGHMRAEDTKPYEDWFWTKNRINLIQAHVDTIVFEEKSLSLSDGTSIQYDQLILAVGSKPNKFGWPGQDLGGVSGLYHYQDLEYIERYSKNLQRAVIVGGGLIGIELAEMFHSRHIPVTMLVRESSFWSNVLPAEESATVTQHIKSKGIDLRLGVNLDRINPDENGNAKSVHIKETGEEIPCGYVGLTAGVSPNIKWLKESQLETNRGIVVDEYLKTNIPDVYAIGDCAELQSPKKGRRGVEAIWYTGRIMGETVAHTICKTPTAYDPGLWFNSAKFIDIEYQVYGQIPAKIPDNVKSLYWQHPNLEKSIRINYDILTGAVLGFNLMGIRYRHEVCEKWLASQSHIETVLKDLAIANFDPEFFKKYEKDLIDLYNKQTGSSISLSQRGGLSEVFSFLNNKRS